MKTIRLSDEDYETIMSLSKELQNQPNHSQAFPYFWEPASEKLITDVNNEGNVAEVYDENDLETMSPGDYAENNPDLYKNFLEYKDRETTSIEYVEELENEWVGYIELYGKDARVYSSNWEQLSEHNPSLFLTDVQKHIKTNSHNLGRNPCTYARTFHRMPKMESLVKIIYGINQEHGQNVNDEASLFILNNTGKKP